MRIPDPSLVLLVGPSGAGKSTFARRHFGALESVSSDRCRALVANDEGDQSATRAAFEVLHHIVAKRLERPLLTVVDATNVSAEARRPLIELSRRSHVPCVAIVLDMPEATCVAHNTMRAERIVATEVVRHQRDQLHKALGHLAHEGYHSVHLLRSVEDVARVTIARVPLPVDRRHERGPFDIVGDVHGCGDELESLLVTLGYMPNVSLRSGRAPSTQGDVVWRHPSRRLVFVGDLVDRGPRVADVLRTAMATVESGAGFAVPGNHDAKLVKKLRGRNVQVTHGLAESLEQLERETPAFRAHVAGFLEGLPSHLVFDDGRLIVAHAGIRVSHIGRESQRVRDFALYGETTGDLDAYGLPVRVDWASAYHGPGLVVYGHTPVAEPRFARHAVNVDTGCVFGGALTALRWPEMDVVSVPAQREYAVSSRPFLPRHFAERGA